MFCIYLQEEEEYDYEDDFEVYIYYCLVYK